MVNGQGINPEFQNLPLARRLFWRRRVARPRRSIGYSKIYGRGSPGRIESGRIERIKSVGQPTGLARLLDQKYVLNRSQFLERRNDV
jgi:hypothetical protein